MKVIFFGSSDYCLPIVETLSNNFNLISIVTKKNQSVEKFAQSHNIKTFTPANKEELLNLKKEISMLKPDLAIVADYGLLIPKEIFSIPRYRTLNIHFSLLPKLRGPAPVQYTILLGEEKAGISVIIMDEDLDTGDIVWQKEISLMNNETMEPRLNGIHDAVITHSSQTSSGQCNNETTGTLYQKLFNIAASELQDVINKYVNNKLKPQKQENSLATFTKHFARQNGFIPSELLGMAIEGINPDQKKLDLQKLNLWSLSSILFSISDTNASDSSHPYQLAKLIDRALRALSPWPGLWTTVQITDNKKQITKRLKVLKVHLDPSTTNHQQPTKLAPDLVQLEGKKPVTWKQFLLGYPGIFTKNKN